MLFMLSWFTKHFFGWHFSDVIGHIKPALSPGR
jgi:hypothetical protein